MGSVPEGTPEDVDRAVKAAAAAFPAWSATSAEERSKTLARVQELSLIHISRRSPAGRLGRLHELGWAATWLCSPFAAFVTGHTLVVDGANWLRRDFVMPEFVPVRQQIGGVLGERGG